MTNKMGETKRTLSFTQEQIDLISKLAVNEIKNGNTVNPVPCELSHDEYKLLFKIISEIRA